MKISHQCTVEGVPTNTPALKGFNIPTDQGFFQFYRFSIFAPLVRERDSVYSPCI